MGRPLPRNASNDDPQPEPDEPRHSASTYVLARAAWILTLVACHADGASVPHRCLNMGPRDLPTVHHECLDGYAWWHRPLVLEPGTEPASCDCAGPA